ncbi:hypothetical protein SAMN05428975_0005 [Mucilaginibacter sp. OK268]|uniref:hypothetical protein n=1 Tax=Mucilaginibacter sp. OK268 TaxID=1881048 RepID=UPI00088E567D|nr:hypothetical protein [Mucilaginibacter sp. OK268]SDP01022.1 hypothetical protein SAMN05428975_0005 [Mucilaginibacter sp. OK268]
MKALLRWIGYSAIILLSLQVPLYAQNAPVVRYAQLRVDSGAVHNRVISATAFKKPDVTADNTLSAADFDEESYLQKVASLDVYGKKHDARPIAKLLKADQVKAVTSDKKRSHKFYYHMANIFARLRMYSLAMKCYFKTLQVEDERIGTRLTDSVAVDSSYTADNKPTFTQINLQDNASIAGLLAINKADEQMLAADSGNYDYPDREIKSPPTQLVNIIDPFDDGKKASAYALLIHISQPVSGKRRIFVKLSKVGHTFITLIKYNADSTSVSRSFGFYPKKDHFLSATPLFPTTGSVFKNDELHGWDETVGKFISERRFKRILKVIKQFDQKNYNLNRNNCTDFGLSLASTAGISILYTNGSWPLGRGNNPASAGQSVLEGKVLNTDNNYNLFICNDLLRENQEVRVKNQDK